MTGRHWLLVVPELVRKAVWQVMCRVSQGSGSLEAFLVDEADPKCIVTRPEHTVNSYG